MSTNISILINTRCYDVRVVLEKIQIGYTAVENDKLSIEQRRAIYNIVVYIKDVKRLEINNCWSAEYGDYSVVVFRKSKYVYLFNFFNKVVDWNGKNLNTTFLQFILPTNMEATFDLDKYRASKNYMETWLKAVKLIHEYKPLTKLSIHTGISIYNLVIDPNTIMTELDSLIHGICGIIDNEDK